MGIPTNRKRWLTVISFLALLIACSSLTHLALNRSSQSLQYPDAAHISQHTIRNFFPHPTFKQSHSYLTNDTYPQVVQWYTSRFRLGAERQAQSSCSHYHTSRFVLFSTQTTSLTLCDTQNGRMIFVQQTTSLNWRTVMNKRP